MSWFVHTIPEWLEVVALAACIGALSCRFMLMGTPEAAPGLVDRLHSGIWRLLGLSLAVMAVCSAAGLLVRAAEMTGRPLLSVWPILSAVAFHTHFGQVMLARIAAAALAFAVFLAAPKAGRARWPLFLLAGIVAIASMTESMTGHAADKGDLSLAEAMDWLHLAAVSVWGGGLIVLSASVLPGLLRAGPEAAPLTAVMARRFSTAAGMAVFVVLATSLYGAWVNVGGLAALPGTPYGRLLIGKTGLFVLLMGLGAFNRYVSVPRLQPTGDPGTDGPGLVNALSRFRVKVGAEAALVLAVLLLATLLRHEMPAKHYSPPGSPACPGCQGEGECIHH